MLNPEIPIIHQSLKDIYELSDCKVIHKNLYTQGLFPIEKWKLRNQENTFDTIVKNLTDKTMVVSEFQGLQSIAQRGGLVPKVYGILEDSNHYLLLMDFCGGEFRGSKDFCLKNNLLNFYSSSESKWGWHSDNFIGTLPQKNRIYDNFSEYWMDSRIYPMLDLIENHGISTTGWKNELVIKVDHSIQKWNLNSHIPRLIHGDLWSGNVLFAGIQSYLIDPAVAYGNPEQDLAMLSLFGSPLSDQSKQEILDSLNQGEDWKTRVPFWLIYPLLVHVGIFGSGYINQLRSTIDSLPDS